MSLSADEYREHLATTAVRAGFSFDEVVPPQGHYTQVGGMRLHYLDWGNKHLPPMLFLHGGALTAHTWDLVCLALRDEYHVEGSSAPITLRANLVVTEVPFSSEDLLAYVDTSKGGLVIDRGQLDGPDLSIMVTWASAKSLLVEGNPQAALSAFMEGIVRIEGDVGKLMAFQSKAGLVTAPVPPDPHELVTGPVQIAALPSDREAALSLLRRRNSPRAASLFCNTATNPATRGRCLRRPAS